MKRIGHVTPQISRGNGLVESANPRIRIRELSPQERESDVPVERPRTIDEITGEIAKVLRKAACMDPEGVMVYAETLLNHMQERHRILCEHLRATGRIHREPAPLKGGDR